MKKTIISLMIMLLMGITTRAAGKTSVLYLFAHEDDELSIIAKMASDVRSGKDVHVVWITATGRGRRRRT